MKEKLSNDLESYMETIKANKQAFREHQRNPSFTEKMQIAFALAERDKTIRRAVLLPKQKKRR